MVSIGSLALSIRAILDEHRDAANYVYDRAATQLALQAAALRLLSPADLEARFDEAVAAGDVVVAESYLALADRLDYRLSEESLAALEEANTTSGTLWRNTRRVAAGFLYGEGPSLPHLAGAMTSDLTLYGDLRDVTLQTRHYLTGEEVDPLIFGLSGAGLVLTAGTYLTYGVAAPVKFWVSALKFAKSSGSLSDGFAAYLQRTIRTAMPVDRLRLQLAEVPYRQRVQGLQPAALRDDLATAFGQSLDPGGVAKLQTIMMDLDALNRLTGSPETVLRGLKLVDGPRELVRLRLVAEAAGPRTAAYAESFGKSLFKTIRYSFKTTTKLYMKYAWGLMSLLGSLMAAFFFFGAKTAALWSLR